MTPDELEGALRRVRSEPPGQVRARYDELDPEASTARRERFAELEQALREGQEALKRLFTLAMERGARITDLEQALRRVPIARPTKDALSWECPGCGSRSRSTPDGHDSWESCKADCWVAAVEAALPEWRQP